MKTNKSTFYFLFLIALAVSATSCVTTKTVRYLQDMPTYGMPINESLEATVAPFDELRIYVLSNTGKDDELIKPFNVLGGNLSQNYVNQGMGYLVDAEGNIQFPVLGKLHVQGLTRLQLQDTIAAQLIRNGQLKDPLVVARFLNFKVFMLSSSGGRVINVTNERCTFLEALAMAGGLDWYTRRDRIGVMREVNGKRVIHYLDPRSTEIFNDEFFVLQQNDIIFTEERPYKFFNSNLNTVLGFISSITGLATSAVAIYSIYKMFKPNN
ncbi:MAG: polysaccharide biosynthesis/export family protein [Bacteroidales bacterium]|nr:polysaccharide biosynthesis/export family protein [Bacteroidales bacterium]